MRSIRASPIFSMICFKSQEEGCSGSQKSKAKEKRVLALKINPASIGTCTCMSSAKKERGHDWARDLLWLWPSSHLSCGLPSCRPEREL